MYDLRVIAAVVVTHQLDIRTCTAQNCSQTLLQRFNDAVITFIRQAKYTNDTRYSSIYTVINVGERVSTLTSFLWTILSTACPNIELVNSYLSLFSKVGWLFFTHMYCWHDIGVSYLLRWPEMNYCDTVVTANTLFTHNQDPSLPPLSSPPVSLVSLKKQSISFSRKGAHKTVLTLIHHCLPLPLLSYTHPDPPLPISPSSLLYSPWSTLPTSPSSLLYSPWSTIAYLSLFSPILTLIHDPPCTGLEKCPMLISHTEIQMMEMTWRWSGGGGRGGRGWENKPVTGFGSPHFQDFAASSGWSLPVC